MQDFECPSYNDNGSSIVESLEEIYAEVLGSSLFQMLPKSTLQNDNIACGPVTKIVGDTSNHSLTDKSITLSHIGTECVSQLCCTVSRVGGHC